MRTLQYTGADARKQYEDLVDAEGVFLQIEEELLLFPLIFKESESDLSDDRSNMQMLKKALCDA